MIPPLQLIIHSHCYYIISHAGEDQRPYLENKILGVLNSWSSRTLVNNEGYKIFKNLEIFFSYTNSTVANCQQCSGLGISLINNPHFIDVLVVQFWNLSKINFWNRFLKIYEDYAWFTWLFHSS